MARLPRNGPWLVSLVLAALIAVELARIGVALLGGAPVKSVVPAPRPATAALPGHSGVDAAAIQAAHLFGIAKADSAAQDPSTAPLSAANLVLAGTIATQDPRHGVAIISDGGPSKVYAVGDNVGGASLHSVYLDHVLLDRAGALETLMLPRQLPPSRAAIARVPAAPNSNTAASVENLRHIVEQNPSVLNEIMRTVPSYDNQQGKLRGFRIYPGRNRSAFNGLGLRPGDLVTGINGTPLDDPQRSREVLNTIESSDRATVTIERGGQTQDITLNIAQVATQATRDLAGAPPAAPPAGAPGSPGMGAGAGAAADGATSAPAVPPAPAPNSEPVP
jgi:general secretion pathway protein C